MFLHRNKKEQDPNEGKWIGIGGKIEENESPEEGMLREFREETGLELKEFAYRGLITFVSDCWDGELMHLYTATAFEGTLCDCVEGDLVWRPFSDIFSLPRWAGDDIFLHLLQEEQDFFSLELVYQGEELVNAVLNGQKMEAR